MKKRLWYLYTFFGLTLLLIGCGIELEIYQWRKIDLTVINSGNNSPIASDESLPSSQYAIEVNLNPESLINVKSSDWVSASNGYQSNDQVISVQVITATNFNERYGQGDDMTEEFEAGPPGASESERLPIQNYLSTFGRSSSVIDSAFVLYLKPIDFPRTQPVRFDVLVNLSRGSIFGNSTPTVNLVKE